MEKQCQALFFWAPKSLQMVTAAMKLKYAYSWEETLKAETLLCQQRSERLLLNHVKTPGFLAPGGEFNPGPETRLDRSELLCNKVLLKYKGDRESF